MQRYPVIIVGGGIIGIMIAREITRHDKTIKVLVIEQSLAGHGASRFSAGVHFPRGASERVRTMSEYSHRYYQELIQKLDVPIYPLDMTVVCDRSNQGIVETQYLPLSQLREIHSDERQLSNISLPDRFVTLKGLGANHADVYGLVGYLLKEMGNQIELIEGASVESFTRSRPYVLGLSTGQCVEAERLVLAPGPWAAGRPWQSVLSDLGVRVKKVVAAHVRIPVKPEDGMIVFQEDDAFLLPLCQRGYWLFSYTCDEWDVDPGATGPSLSFKDISDARGVLAKYSPGSADRLDGGRVFCDAYSPDRAPIAVELSRHLIFAGAANGSGYRLAPAIAGQVLSLL